MDGLEEALLAKIKFGEKPDVSNQISNVSDRGEKPKEEKQEQKPKPLPEPISFNDEWDHVPPPQETPILKRNDGETFVPKGDVGIVTAPGGVGKTQFALQFGRSVATGADFLDFKAEPGEVLCLFGEEPEKEIRKRNWKAYSKEPDMKSQRPWKGRREDLKEYLHFMALKGFNCAFMKDLNKVPVPDNLNTVKTEFFNHVKEITKRFKELTLIIIDPLSRFLGPNDANDAQVGTALIQLCEELSMEHPNNPTVLISAHTNKDAYNKKQDQGSLRGTSSFGDGARFMLALERIEPSAFGSSFDTRSGKRTYFHTKRTVEAAEELMKKKYQHVLVLKITKANGIQDYSSIFAMDKQGAMVALTENDRKILFPPERSGKKEYAKASDDDVLPGSEQEDAGEPGHNASAKCPQDKPGQSVKAKVTAGSGGKPGGKKKAKQEAEDEEALLEAMSMGTGGKP